MIEHFRLTQTAGILHVSTDFFLKISFNPRSESSLPALCVYIFLTFIILNCICCVLSVVNQTNMLCYVMAPHTTAADWPGRKKQYDGRVESFRSWSSQLFRGRPGGRRHVRSAGPLSDTLKMRDVKRRYSRKSAVGRKMRERKMRHSFVE